MPPVELAIRQALRDRGLLACDVIVARDVYYQDWHVTARLVDAEPLAVGWYYQPPLEDAPAIAEALRTKPVGWWGERPGGTLGQACCWRCAVTWQEMVEARQQRIRARLVRSRMDALPTSMLAYLPRLIWQRWLYERGGYQDGDYHRPRQEDAA